MKINMDEPKIEKVKRKSKKGAFGVRPIKLASFIAAAKNKKSKRKSGKVVRPIKKTRPEKRKASFSPSLERFEDNPIIEPSSHQSWESKATFNPSAVFGGGKVHLIYRAIGDNDISVFGYASSKDGFTIDLRGVSPAYFQKKSFPDKNFLALQYLSGGGWNGGSEDPRLTLIDGRVYMLYTSFDGWGSVRMAMTSISFEDFARQNWNWEPGVFISPPGEVHKNWVLFPEKIKGKYAILHGISPHILIDYAKDLKEFDGLKYIKSLGRAGYRHDASWDNMPRGVGPAPIKTKYGWLILYHAMDTTDPNRYKLGAMLLDLEEPAKVLVRSAQPILEPDELYENEGFKSGVVYACGAVVVDGWLFVYYGGADKVVCVATAELEPFLKKLVSSGSPRLAVSRPKK